MQTAMNHLCIDATAEREVREWSARFGCTPEALRAAVRTAGTLATDVEHYLKVCRLPLVWQTGADGLGVA